MENTDGYKMHEKLSPIRSMNNDSKSDTKLPDNELNTLKGDFVNLMDAENQTNNNNNKNRCNKIHKIDHNVVIDDAKQSQQQSQQQQQPLKSYGCKHYKRQAKFVVSRTHKIFCCFFLFCVSVPFTIFFIEKLFEMIFALIGHTCASNCPTHSVCCCWYCVREWF